MSKILKKNTAGDYFITDMGVTVPGNGQLLIDPNLYTIMQASSDVITALSDGDLILNDGSHDITELASAVNIIQGGEPSVNVNKTPPFAAKTVDGFDLYTRCTGTSFNLSVGYNECKFTIPFAIMKFNGIKIGNGELGDTANLYVWDSVNGDYTTYPNYQLNQFGYTVNIDPGKFEKKSDYDADVYIGMQIVMDYYSESAKTIYVNYDIHELKA